WEELGGLQEEWISQLPPDPRQRVHEIGAQHLLGDARGVAALEERVGDDLAAARRVHANDVHRPVFLRRGDAGLLAVLRLLAERLHALGRQVEGTKLAVAADADMILAADVER